MSIDPQASGESATRIVNDPANTFSIEVPVDWQKDMSGQHGSVLIVYHPQADGDFQANVNVLVDDIAPLTSDEHITLSRLQLKQLTGFAQLPVDQVSPDRPEAHLFEWMTDRSSPPIRVRQLVLFSESQAYTITATASLDHFENHRSVFDAILNSFKMV